MIKESGVDIVGVCDPKMILESLDKRNGTDHVLGIGSALVGGNVRPGQSAVQGPIELRTILCWHVGVVRGNVHNEIVGGMLNDVSYVPRTGNRESKSPREAIVIRLLQVAGEGREHVRVVQWVHDYIEGDGVFIRRRDTFLPGTSKVV